MEHSTFAKHKNLRSLCPANGRVFHPQLRSPHLGGNQKHIVIWILYLKL